MVFYLYIEQYIFIYHAMQNKIRITFVVPAYNEEARLAATLDSIVDEVKHTRFTAEIIVVDNGSRDRPGRSQSHLKASRSLRSV